MKHTLYSLIALLLLSDIGQAQILPGLRKKNKLITYTGKVVDAETGEPLPFSQINHIYKFVDKDSLVVRNLIADKDGKFEFQSPRIMNNRIEVICLGYQILTRMLSEAGNQIKEYSSQENKKLPEIHNRIDLGVLKLIPDVQLLNEVEVKARIKLFEMSGDTLMVFPKNIKQFEGETLAEVLKRLPNFSVSEQGDIFVDGKRIERAMLNDKHIFGEDVRTMVTSIMAKEAGLIKVYDEIDETAEILKGKEFARKRKVMNVITFKDFNMFKGGEVRLEAGLYADKDADGDQQTMHDAYGRIGQYTTNFRIAVEGNTEETAFPQRKQETGAGIKAEVSSPDLLKSMNVNYRYGKDEQEQESRTEQFYFPTAYFESQITEQSNNNLQDKHAHNFSLNGKYIKKSVFSLQGRYSGSIEDVDQQSLFLSNMTKDGQQLSYLQQIRENSNRNYEHSVYLDMVPSLGKGSSIQLLMIGTIAKKSNEGIREDTSYAGDRSDKQIFNISGETPKYDLFTKLDYCLRIWKSFIINYKPSISYHQSEQLYWAINRSTGKVDSLTSRNQIWKNLKISNAIGSGIERNISRNNHMLDVTIKYNIYRFLLNERFPESLKTEKRFQTWDVWAQYLLILNGGTFRLIFETYDEPFSVSNLSTRFNDNNPMYLSTGNPNLKMEKYHKFTYDLSLQNGVSVFGGYEIITNPILQTRRYFETNTLLPEFDDYEALAGATLTTPINAKNYNHLMLSVNGNSKRGAILVRGLLNYSFKNPETDLLGEIVRSYEHRTNGGLSLISNFSSTFRLDITESISYAYTKLKAEELQKYSQIHNKLTAKANLQLFYRMMVNADYTYNYNYNTRSKKTNNIQTMNASIDYRIFSNRRGLVSINAYNLLNTKSSFTTTSTDLYMQNTYRPENSTLFTVSFRYKFGVEQ